MKQLFDEVSSECSKVTTERYSTSFSSAIRLLHKDLHAPIYHIYGFVRFADEIVDSFHQYKKNDLLLEFKRETFLAIERGISLNPILNSFQSVVNKYNIEKALIEAFFSSMESDLSKLKYDEKGYREYIYGSAEVVGLMCLFVFCEGDKVLYGKLNPYARALGAAFQKINFLRDVKADSEDLSRVYFPDVDFNDFSTSTKKEIEHDIQKDLSTAYEGILQLPVKAKFGVYVAYKYYLKLFKKIKSVSPDLLLEERVRIPNYSKALVLFSAGVRSQLNIL
jgi:phytoene/squalene synthetase